MVSFFPWEPIMVCVGASYTKETFSFTQKHVFRLLDLRSLKKIKYKNMVFVFFMCTDVQKQFFSNYKVRHICVAESCLGSVHKTITRRSKSSDFLCPRGVERLVTSEFRGRGRAFPSGWQFSVEFPGLHFSAIDTNTGLGSVVCLPLRRTCVLKELGLVWGTRRNGRARRNRCPWIRAAKIVREFGHRRWISEFFGFVSEDAVI